MLKLFERIASTNSPSEKIQLLLTHPCQEELRSVLRYATDPFLTFGITQVEGEPKGNADCFHVLDQLSRRELTGKAAKLALGESAIDQEDQEILTRIIRKDLRCGVGEKLVLQAYPGLIRQFDVMRADKFKGLSSRSNYVIEPKMDGLRCIAMVDRGSVTLLSRNGKEFTSSDHLKDQLKELAINYGSVVFDGELVSGNFNSSVSAVKNKSIQNDSTFFHVFDMMTLDEWKSPTLAYYIRRYHLEEAFKDYQGTHLKLVPSFKVESEIEAMKKYNYFRDQGFEGGIIKDYHGKYRFKRHKDWMKLKAVNDVDLVVHGLIQGEGKYHGMLGAVVVNYRGKRVNVGTGFSDSERELYWKDPSLLMRKVIEIQYHEETPDGSLRHPRFIKVREDKS